MLPYQAEERVRIEHPEWIPCDRWGERRAPGPLEYAYPGARKQFVDRVLHHVAAYDGVAFYTYVENYGYRYPEEFGFNEPIVSEFIRRYGVDIRTQKFDKQAWYRLRGEYVTQVLTELHAALSRKHKKLSIVVWADNPTAPMGWQKYTTWTALGPIYMDYEKWLREGIIDEIIVFHHDEQFVSRLIGLSKGKSLSIVVLGAATEAEAKAGVTSMTDIWSAVCAGRMTPAAVTAADLAGPDWMNRAQTLIDAAGGAIKLDPADVGKAASDPNVLVRREAMRTLAAMGARDQLPVIEKALSDRENSVRAAAAAALAKVNGPDSPACLIDAVRRNPAFQVKNAAVASLKAMLPRSEPALIRALADECKAVREIAARALADSPTQESQTALMRALGSDSRDRVRYWALAALVRRPAEGLAACRSALSDSSTTVQLQAARNGPAGPVNVDVGCHPIHGVARQAVPGIRRRVQTLRCRLGMEGSRQRNRCFRRAGPAEARGPAGPAAR